MGSELICFIVVGPAILDEWKKPLAVERAGSIIKAAQLLHEGCSEYEEDRYLDLLQSEVGSYLDDQCEDFRYISGLNAIRTVEDLYQVWSGGGNDTNSRACPHNESEVIVVAGEITWGDEPKGFGYQALRAASKTGLFKIFNIR